MLEGLNAVRWGELTHAYGQASDVPGLLRSLAGPDPAFRAKALDDLYGNIWHQNTVYEATAHAVPFLVEIAGDPSVQGREEVLPLLNAIANGTSYHDVHQHLEILKEEAEKPEWQESIRRELVWVEAARDAVRAGVPAYLRLLDDASAPVRTAAAYLLANFSGEVPAIDAALRHHLDEERDPVARASTIRALGRTVEETPERIALLSGLLRSEADALTRLAAAMALAIAAGERMPAEAVETLVAALATPEDLEERYAELPWNDDGLDGDAATHLSVLGSTANTTVLPRVMEALGRATAWPALSLTEVALHMAFGSARPPKEARASDLSEDQRSVLAALAANPEAWTINANMSDILRAYALPNWKDGMDAFLEAGVTIEEASALRTRAARPEPRPPGLLDRVRRWFSG